MTLDPALLKDLYKLSVEEDRYQVQLNWDRMKFLLLLNVSLLAASAALLRGTSSRVAALLALLTFCAGAIVALIGLIGLGEGKEYHRRSVAKSVALGEMLGLTVPTAPTADPEFTLQLVSGMRRSKAQSILAAPEAHATRKLRRWSVSDGLRAAFIASLALDLTGVALSIYVGGGCWWGGCS